MSSIGRIRYQRALGSALARISRSTPSAVGRNSSPQWPAAAHLPAAVQARLLVTSSSPSTSAPSSSTAYSSINADEIHHFSRLSSQWWDPNGEFGLLHRMNPPRIEYVRQKVALNPDDEPPWTFEGRHGDQARQEKRGSGRWLSGKRCLDIGCGGGLLSESLARLGGNVIGVDASESNIAIATLHASQDPLLPFRSASASSQHTSQISDSSTSTKSPSGSLSYRHSTAEHLRDAGEQFDVVCAMEVVEHVEEPGEFMKCLGDLVKPGGHLVMSTISRTALSRLLTITLAEDLLRLVTPGTHTHHKFIKPEELRRFVYAEMGGYNTWYRNTDASDIRTNEVGSTQGIIYDPVAGGWKLWTGTEGTWSKDLGEGCNYLFHAKKREA